MPQIHCPYCHQSRDHRRGIVQRHNNATGARCKGSEDLNLLNQKANLKRGWGSQGIPKLAGAGVATC